MFAVDDPLDFFIIYCLKCGILKTSEKASYKLIPSKDGPVRDHLSTDWMGSL